MESRRPGRDCEILPEGLQPERTGAVALALFVTLLRSSSDGLVTVGRRKYVSTTPKGETALRAFGHLVLSGG